MTRAGLSTTIASAILAVLFLAAGGTKLAGMEQHVRNFAEWGYPDWFRLVVGTVEVVSAGLVLVPATRLYGALGICVIMTGAIATHLVHGQYAQAPIPAVLLVLAGALAHGVRPGAPGTDED